MVNVFGKKMTKSEFLEYFADPDQYASILPYTFSSGNANGVRAIGVKTGGGLNYTILPGRAMDIAYADYKGVPLSFISKSGIVNPHFFESDGTKWLRGFYAGLMTTCGLTYMGAPCEDNGESLGLHGRIAYSEAYDLAINSNWMGNELILSASGKVRQGVLFGESLVMERTILSRAGSSAISITTTIENMGFEKQPLMLLFHFNFGYPMVSADSEIVAPVKKVTPRDDDARADNGVANYLVLHEPKQGYKEKVFFLQLDANKDGDTEVMLYNKKLNVGIIERFNINQCPKYTLWKQLGKGDYVLGLEPGNALPIGRDKVRESGELQFINPSEIKEYSIQLQVIEGEERINLEKERIENIDEYVPQYL
ncbi:MAG: aldose 1-epimerase family protein [Promethearchaeota archaeon]